jgi:hypothetical protein
LPRTIASHSQHTLARLHKPNVGLNPSDSQTKQTKAKAKAKAKANIVVATVCVYSHMPVFLHLFIQEDKLEKLRNAKSGKGNPPYVAAFWYRRCQMMVWFLHDRACTCACAYAYAYAYAYLYVHFHEK